jgi:hypothetical protein
MQCYKKEGHACVFKQDNFAINEGKLMLIDTNKC